MDLQNAQKAIELDRMDIELDELAGKAVTAEQHLAVLALRADSIEARLALAERESTGPVEGKNVTFD